MRPLLQSASRTFLANSVNQTVVQSHRNIIGNLVKASQTSLCRNRQFQTSSSPLREFQLHHSNTFGRAIRRQLSVSAILREKEPPLKPSNPLPESESTPSRSPETESVLSNEPKIPPQSKIEDTIARVAAEDLPSHREKQRWDFSKRITGMMDELLPKLAVVTQKVNTYTGTDYSSIDALRREIKDQESLVKARRQAIDQAKHTLDAAHSQQAAAQKEVVALLERKHSWSATDLERYMSLIRSEHVNDQAVREAKEAVFNAENALEEARTLLEKRERAQYHEEQIWSDTIRRNSTWVTFGLMGFNIFLLLATMIVIEPWRRRRMVREIKTALDAQKSAVNASPTPSPTIPAILPYPIPSLEAAIDQAVEPTGQTLEELASSPPDALPAVFPIPGIELHYSNPEVDRPLHTDAVNPVKATDHALEAPASEAQSTLVAAPEAISEFIKNTTWQEKLVARGRDLMSDQQISMRKRDLTNAVLEGAALGAVITGVLLQILWRSG